MDAVADVTPEDVVVTQISFSDGSVWTRASPTTSSLQLSTWTAPELGGTVTLAFDYATGEAVGGIVTSVLLFPS